MHILVTFSSLYLEGKDHLDITPPMPLLEPESGSGGSADSHKRFVKLSMKTGNRLSEKLSVKQRTPNEKSKSLRSLPVQKKKDRRILLDLELEARSRRKNKCSKYPTRY